MVQANVVDQMTDGPSKSRILTRFATPKDVAQVERIHHIINAAYRSGDGWCTESHLVGGERMTKDELAELLSNSAADDADPLILALVDNGGGETIVGTVQIEARNHHPPTIGLLSVDPAYQSGGVGGALLNKALEVCKETLRSKKVAVWVIESRDDILKWYTRKGFMSTGEKVPFVMPTLAKKENMMFSVYVKDL